MELGQRLKQARLQAGLSQRQLCGDVITRNMLSLIENGSAKPSMDTLQLLAARLGLPVSYFLDEQSITSVNGQIMTQARTADPEQVLDLLQSYQAPDPVFDPERYLLEALSCFVLAERAIGQEKPGLAVRYLRQAAAAGEQTPYYTQDTERRRILLLAQTHTQDAVGLATLLPDYREELLLRAQAALQQQNLQAAQAFLSAVVTPDPVWHKLQADVYFAQQNYALAAQHYTQTVPCKKIYERLEFCYKELKDFEKAYFYACQQR